MGAVSDRNAFHEGGDGITDGHLEKGYFGIRDWLVE